MTGDNKTHPSTNRTLDVTAVGCDDGFDAGAKALACFDNVAASKPCYAATMRAFSDSILG